AAAAAEAEDANAVARHFAVNRRRIARDERQHRQTHGPLTELPAAKTREEAAEELHEHHGTLGIEAATSKCTTHAGSESCGACHTGELPSKPIRSRTTASVSRASDRHRCAPPASASSTS